MDNVNVEHQQLSFEKRKTSYFANFAKSHLSAFRPHQRKGETLGKGQEVWRNVSEHCLAAGVYADILAEEMHLPMDQRSAVVKAAILHDWNKKNDSLIQQAASKEGTLSVKTFSEMKERGDRALQEMGVPQDIITLSGANLAETPEGPQGLPEKIIWYVDSMLTDSEPVPLRKRFDDLEHGWYGTRIEPERAERNKAFSDSYKEQFGGKSLFDINRELGDRIDAEFARLMGYQGEVDQLPLYLKEKLIERIMKT